MEVFECIETRRSIRKFEDRPIDRNIITRLVAEAQLAPTWKNSQTARFTALTDKALLAEACQALPGFNATIVSAAPLLLAVSAVTGRSGFETDGTPTTVLGEAYTYFDCGTTVQTFCLAANSLGIGTVILGIFDQFRLKALLNIPDNETLVVLVACGYKVSEPHMPARYPLNDVLRLL